MNTYIYIYVCVNTNVVPLTSVGNVSMVTCGEVASNMYYFAKVPRDLLTISSSSDDVSSKLHSSRASLRILERDEKRIRR